MKVLDRQEAASLLQTRKNARERFLPFVELMHHKWKSGTHHKLICEALERVERGECRRLLIETPPRHSKSELASKKFPAWYLGRHPRRQIITASYAGDLATEFGRDVRNLVASKEYRTVFPNVSLAVDSQASGRWHTNYGGSYAAAGIGGVLTGRGAHVALIDDPIKNREEADSERTRDSIWKWYTSTLLTRMMPGGSIVLIMTRWHESDLAGRVLESEDWERINLPAITNEGTDNEIALWPERYDLDELHRTRSVMIKGGRGRDWQALYQQNPTPDESGFIKADWFRLRDKPSGKANIYMASDFAVTEPAEGKDPDYTEHGVFSIGEDGKLYVIDWWSGQTTPDVWIERLLDLVDKHKPLCWFGEGGVIRRSIEPYLIRRMRERKVFFRHEWITSIKDKATRGRAFQARAASGQVVFSPEPWAERIIGQCAAFGAGRNTHDDAFDVMSLMCRCIDQAHPAIGGAIGVQQARTKRGYKWEKEDASWKTA